MELLPLLSGITLVLLMTCFVKIVTTLSILRYGLGLHGVGFGVVIVAASVALSWFIMEPQLGTDGVASLFQGKGLQAETSGEVEKKFTPFLEKNVDQRILTRLSRVQEKLADQRRSPGQQESTLQTSQLSVLTVSFLLTELQEAFHIGFIIVLPFLIVDLLVANVLMVLGITQLSVLLASLPFKILLFFAVDGWALLSEKLVMTYV